MTIPGLTRSLRFSVLAAALLLAAGMAGVAEGTVERIQVRGRGLENNLSGDSPVRDVAVYLPAGYFSRPDQRFPVVYMLHGFTDSVAKWFSPEHWITLPDVLDRAAARDDTRDVIVVMPDALTRFGGSMYSNSVTTGDWERFIAEELTAYIDSHYRTLPNAASRGLAGHSMGGYGAMRIGMKHPRVFASLYLLSPCCLAPRAGRPSDGDGIPAWETIQTDEEFANAAFGVKAVFAGAAAWAPNPKNPPFFLDLPTKNGKPRPDVLARLTANAPLALLDQYVDNLEQLEGLAFDAGDQDQRIAATIRVLDRVLNDYGIEHDFAIYEGNHVNRIAERIETKMMPFFGEHLKFE